MFGEVDGSTHTYFADSPVIITVSGLEWPSNTPFAIVRLEVLYGGSVVGEFKADTGRQSSISFDISSALRAVWSDYDFDSNEVSAAASAGSFSRGYRTCSMVAYTEYLDSQDGEFTQTTSGTFGNLHCAIGGLTEWERSLVANADASTFEHTNLRNGDASTKPTESPERVGRSSITSWVDVSNSGTQSVFYPASATAGEDSQSAHAPLVLRDSQEYVDFLFLNRRGAIETCSGQTLESMGINVKVTQYSRTGHPSFNSVRSLMAIGQDGRRSWQMSSGYVTREWAEWWALEFLGGKRKQWWMRYPIGDANGTYVPIIVEPAKQDISIYDRSKQQMPHVDFTVTLALEG